MELFDMLRKDHEKVKKMFNQFDMLKEEPEKKKGELEKLFGEIRKELQIHMEGEEKFFYPALRNSEETHDEVLESIEEHHVVKLLMKELERTQVSEKWVAKLSVMKENVLHHISEEEEELFEKAQELLGDRAKEIGKQISSMKH
jgi:hemerythrin superfamily protein